MKKQTIQRNIQLKIEDWLSSITDTALANDLRNNLLVSGGSIASMFLNEQVNDYDIYLSNMDIVKRVASYYIVDTPAEILDGRNKQMLIEELLSKYPLHDSIDQIQSKDAVALRNLKDNQIKLSLPDGGYKAEVKDDTIKYHLQYLSPNAISLSDDIQVVLRFYGDHTEIHKTFDFIHATNYFTMKDGLVTNKEAVESLLTKSLVYQGSLYPLTSIIRTKKFIKRGFMITAGEYLKMMFQLSLLDLTNFDVLEEQLIGVDVAYFATLIDALRDHKDRHPDFVFTPEYVNSIIDKVFNGASDYDN